MNVSEIIELIKTKFDAEAIDGLHPCVVIDAKVIVDVCKFLKTNELLKFDFLRCISSVDWPEKQKIELSYDLVSIERTAHSQRLA